MPTNEHSVVLPPAALQGFVSLLRSKLTVPNLFMREGHDRYAGTETHTIKYVVENVIPYHDYEFRSGSATSSTPGVRQEVPLDMYNERAFDIPWGGMVVSGVQITDEQADFDLARWAKLAGKQVDAIGRGIQRKCVQSLLDAPYQATIGNIAGNLYGALIEARRVLNAFHAPDEGRTLLVGSNVEAALLADNRITLAQNVGDARADSALGRSTLGTLHGFNIVSAVEIPADEAYAFAQSGFVLVTGAPTVPASVKIGGSTSFEGIAMRYVQSYDPRFLRDTSVFSAYAATRYIDDVLVYWDEVNQTEVVSTGEHFVRGIKLVMDGSSDYPEVGSELAKATGISSASVWTPTGRKVETDPANA